MCSLSGYPHSFTVRKGPKGEWSDCTVQNEGDFRKGVVAAVEVLPDSDCNVALPAFLGPTRAATTCMEIRLHKLHRDTSA